MEVVEGSPAHEAGLKAGDVIVSINGEKVENPHDLSSRLEEGTHQVTIVRGGSPEKVEVRIESRSQKGEKVSRM